VSKAGLDRALRIMAGLICPIEEAGFTVSVEADRQEKRDQTVAKIHGQSIRFGLTEKVDRVEIAAPPKGGLLERVLTYGGKPVTHEPDNLRSKSGAHGDRAEPGGATGNRTFWKRNCRK
jgi:hypothetical protein